MDFCVSTLTGYFERELPSLPTTYEWRISGINDFGQNGRRDYLANVNLEKYFNEQWDRACHEERLALAKVIVSDWGGVRNNKISTTEKYVLESAKKAPCTPINGVASYSKILAVTKPNIYAIYDARVAACLNAIQYNANGVRKGIAFNYVPGRNKVTGNAGNKAGFSQVDLFKVRSLFAPAGLG